LKYFFQIKKLQLKEHGLNLKVKENEGLLWIFWGSTCKLRWMREKWKKKENSTGAKSNRITMHVPSKKEKNIETNQMTQWNNNFDHLINPHMLSEGNKTSHVINFFIFVLFFIDQITILPPGSNKYYEKTFLKLQKKPWSHIIRISFPGAIGSLHYYLKSKKPKIK